MPIFACRLLNGGNAAETIVDCCPSAQFWELEQMIPTGEKQAVRCRINHLAAGLRLGDHQFDTCFTGVQTR